MEKNYDAKFQKIPKYAKVATGIRIKFLKIQDLKKIEIKIVHFIRINKEKKAQQEKEKQSKRNKPFGSRLVFIKRLLIFCF